MRLASPLVERRTRDDGLESVLIQARGPCRIRLLAEGFGGDTIRSELANRVRFIRSDPVVTFCKGSGTTAR